jgi:L-ascorbate metabolism protein UlaG (beta-lactamase superfamily)
MKITWYGHSAFRIDHGGKAILIDPFLAGNPVWGSGWEGPAEGITHVAITHGHDDHIGNAIEILKATGAQLIANFEICMHLVAKGVSGERINPGNHGGTVDCGGFTATFVQALHSSSSNGVYLGNPAGIVLHFPDAPSVYHMGDTDMFSDMALINELHQPRVAMVPVGDRFTMGGAVAALACRRFFDFDLVFPCHFGTFPMLDPTAGKFVAAMEGARARLELATPGQAVEI